MSDHSVATKKRHIDELRDIVYQCNRCGNCFDLSWLGDYNKCPAYEKRAFESYLSRGKFNIARALVDGQLDYDADVAERVFSCTECRACAEHCFKFLDTTEIFTAMKADLADLGLLPENLRAGLEGPEGLDTTHNVYRAPHEERLAWLSDNSYVDRQAETVFFVGCSSAYVRQNMAADTVDILQRIGSNFTVLSDEWCCGHPYMAAGQLDKAREAMEHNIELFTRMGAKRVVFNCPGCQKTFQADAPKLLGRSLPVRPVHLMEEIALMVEQGSAKFAPLVPKARMVYHDSCTLGRWLGVYEAPRTILSHIPGVTLVEMPRNRRDAYCCGAGGLIRYDYEDIALQAGIDRIREAESTGATVLVTSCPACLMQFQQARSRIKSKIRVVDITELIRGLLLAPPYIG